MSVRSAKRMKNLHLKNGCLRRVLRLAPASPPRVGLQT